MIVSQREAVDFEKYPELFADPMAEGVVTPASFSQGLLLPGGTLQIGAAISSGSPAADRADGTVLRLVNTVDPPSQAGFNLEIISTDPDVFLYLAIYDADLRLRVEFERFQCGVGAIAGAKTMRALITSRLPQGLYFYLYGRTDPATGLGLPRVTISNTSIRQHVGAGVVMPTQAGDATSPNGNWNVDIGALERWPESLETFVFSSQPSSAAYQSFMFS